MHEESDFLTYLNIWDFYHDLKAKLSRSQLRRACAQNFLSYMRMREWCDIHRQLDSLVRDAGMKPRKRTGDYDAIHQSILTGLLSSIAFKSEKFVYTVAGNTKAHVVARLGRLHTREPSWLAAAEIVETTKRYLRTCARDRSELAGTPRWNISSSGPTAIRIGAVSTVRRWRKKR